MESGKLCFQFFILYYYAADHREGDNKPCFCLSVRPSVRLSVACIANNSRTQRPSMPKFGTKVPHVRCDSNTSFKVKRLEVVGAILCRPNVAATLQLFVACSVLAVLHHRCYKILDFFSFFTL